MFCLYSHILWLAGKVNGQWKSLTAFFEMTAYAVAVLIPGACTHILICSHVHIALLVADPQHFWVLTSISAGMVLLALAIFTATNPFGYASHSCGSCCGGCFGGDSGSERYLLNSNSSGSSQHRCVLVVAMR